MKTPTRKITNHQRKFPARITPTQKILTQTIPTWKIPTYDNFHLQNFPQLIVTLGNCNPRNLTTFRQFYEIFFQPIFFSLNRICDMVFKGLPLNFPKVFFLRQSYTTDNRLY